MLSEWVCSGDVWVSVNKRGNPHGTYHSEGAVMLSKVGVTALAFGAAIGGVGLASADGSVLSDRPATVTICHATNANDNPYNMITVAESAVDGRGHDNHTGDIIPPIAGVIPGLNWPEGESTFNHNCITTVEEAVTDDKVTICHATNAENNPYNKITVSRSAVDDGGHRGHTGPVWYPGAKDAGVRWGDIIPLSAGVTGLNWPEGQSTLNNNCELPGTSNEKPVKPKTREPKTTDE